MYQITTQNGILINSANATFSGAIPLDGSGNVPDSILIQSSGCIKFTFKRRADPEHLWPAASFYHTGGDVVMHVAVREEFSNYEIDNLSGSTVKISITPID